MVCDLSQYVRAIRGRPFLGWPQCRKCKQPRVARDGVPMECQPQLKYKPCRLELTTLKALQNLTRGNTAGSTAWNVAADATANEKWRWYARDDEGNDAGTGWGPV